MAEKWPEREGNINAIFLIQSRRGKLPEYDVYEQNKTNGPWYEGTKFYLSDKKLIENHFLIMKYHIDGNGDSSEEIVGVVHNEIEIARKTYALAVDYCKNRAKNIKGRFIDKTNKGLEQLAQSKNPVSGLHITLYPIRG